MSTLLSRPAPHGGRAHRLAAAFPPLGHGEQLRVELPVDEGIPILLPVEGFRNVALVAGADLQPALPVGHRFRGRAPGRFAKDAASHDVVVDVIAAALPGDEIPCFHELLVRVHDGVPRDAELARELSARRYRSARRGRRPPHQRRESCTGNLEK